MYMSEMRHHSKTRQRGHVVQIGDDEIVYEDYIW